MHEIVIFFLLGICFVGAVYSIQGTHLRTVLRITAGAASLIGILITTVVFSQPRFLGIDWWLQHPPWKHLLLYCLMILGMFSNVLYHAIDERRKQKAEFQKLGKQCKPRWSVDKWDFVQPLLPSLLIFGSVMALTGESKLNVQSGVLAFHIGFFWQTTFGKLKKSNKE